MTNPAKALTRRWVALAGGPVRAKVVILLAVVLGADTADLGTIGAIAGKLEHALSLSNTQLGLLAAISAICSAVATVPMGVVADRTGFGANANAHGLQLACLILLITLALGGVLAFIATRTYPRDVATALASEEATTRSGDPSPALPEAA